jgi:hypothetical protein
MSRQRRELVALCLSNPCPASWEDMVGNERVRFCPECQLNVHNLSAMTTSEAETLLNQDGRVCVGFARRPDGSIFTQDPPSGRGVEARKFRRFAGLVAVVALVGCLFFVTVVFTANTELWSGVRQFKPIDAALNWLVPPPAPPFQPVPAPTTAGW